MRFIEAYVEDGQIVNKEWLARAEVVHRQLRTNLPADYLGKMMRVLTEAHMVMLLKDEQVLGLAVYRWHENTADGIKFYVDDLVVDEAHRSHGGGHALLAYMESIAKSHGATGLVLDSATHRARAHKFYFTTGFVINGFNFKKTFS